MLNKQEDYRRSFFSLFYFAINAGSLVSTLVSPIIRGKCRFRVLNYVIIIASGPAIFPYFFPRVLLILGSKLISVGANDNDCKDISSFHGLYNRIFVSCTRVFFPHRVIKLKITYCT